MRINPLPLILVVTLSGCVRSPGPPSAPVENDLSIIFPDFPERDVVDVGAPGQPYELDGEMLRAVMIAANDFLPPGAKNPPCRNRQEAQRYRVIRQGDIVFVHIYEDHAYCGRSYPALDSGAKYAISIDGRILRRVSDGQPEKIVDLEPTDGGHQKTRAEPGVPPALDGIWNDPSRPWPPEFQDGGSSPPPGVSPPAPSSGSDGGRVTPDGLAGGSSQ
jgi:hypothetical protein